MREKNQFMVLFLAHVLLGFLCVSCCRDIVCVGGFEIGISPVDGERFLEGEYQLIFQIEEYEIEFICPANGASTNTVYCEKDDSTEVPDNLVHYCSIYNGYYVVYDSDEISGIVCHFHFESEENRSVRGPRTVELTVRYNGEIVNETSLTPEYNRDEDFWGNTCDGYCENLIGETVYLEL